MLFAGVRIVLVEPAGPLNVGSVARVMKNMGLHRLVLVNPQCDRLSADARQMAVHAVDVLETAQEVKTLPDALKGCQRAIATTGRSDTTLTIPLEHPRFALPWLVETHEANEDVPEAALIFGREDRGLTNEELNYAQRLVYIPANPAYSSLNLAQAVAVCCYELHTCLEQKQEQNQDQTLGARHSVPSYSPTLLSSPSSLSPSSHPRRDESHLYPDLASLDALENFYQHLEEILLKIGYLYPHTAASRMEKFRRLLNRTYPSTTEVAMLRGILSQVNWALDFFKKNG